MNSTDKMKHTPSGKGPHAPSTKGMRMVASLAALCGICAAGTSIAQNASPPPLVVQTPQAAYLNLVDGAADSTAIEWRDAMWATYALVSAAEAKKAGSGLQLLQTFVGLDATTAAKLTAHMTSSIADHDGYSVSMVKERCSDLTARAKTSSNTQLAEALASIEDVTRQHHDNYLSRLPEVLDAASEAKLNAWVDEHVKRTMKIVKVDYSRFLATPGVDRNAVAGRICSLPSLAAAQP